MRRCSESVAALASALAKAQAELVNPEKSLTAFIRTSGRAGEGGERSFRYAPLSSGLDIVRKTLGQHEIATIQTTAIDQAAGLVNLTTMLAHASGEWIASDLPVCPIADMASPQRMGAALTYARRYALFTLVGIAGEDDLDAPDLHDGTDARSPGSIHSAGDNRAGATIAAQGASPSVWPQPRPAGNRHTPGIAKARPPAAAILAAEQSAVLRDRLVGEVAGIRSAEAAANWAKGVLPAKNSLTAADAKAVEGAFEQKLNELPRSEASEQSRDPVTADPVAATPDTLGDAGAAPIAQSAEPAIRRGRQPAGINKSALAIATPRRYRNREHLRYVAQQACLICARKPSDPHHLRFTQPRALGRKVSDEFAVPLCRTHHRAVHRVSDEVAWWKTAGIDPIKVARKLWRRTRLDDGQDRQRVTLQNLAPKSADAGRPSSNQNVDSPASNGRTP